MPAKPDIAFNLRPLQDTDKLGPLKGGHADNQPLTLFAKKHARPYQTLSLARTYVAKDETHDRVAGYITLVCSEVLSKDVVQADGPYPYPHYPAMKIARLLVDNRYRGSAAGQLGRYGLGATMVDFSIGVAKSEICPAVGCRFVVLDAKAGSVGFYRKMGFTLLDTEENLARPNPVMFMDLYKVAA